MPWRDRLGRMLGQHGKRAEQPRPGKAEVRRFLAETVAPALHEVAEELGRHGRETDVEVEPDRVAITVFRGDDEEFYYAVKARTYHKATPASPEMTFEDDVQDTYHRAEVSLREGSQGYGIMSYDREHVIRNFMHEYDKQLRWQKPARREP